MTGNSSNVPGIGFTEVDNTVRQNAAAGDGIGAVVLNANRGYPNQRVLCTTIDKFHEFFGTPDQTDQYGHFAAQVYFDQGGATQLLAVRATMGDEGYSQIQYPYTDSIYKNSVEGLQSLDFVDGEMGDNVRLINPISEDMITPEVASADGFTGYDSGACFSYTAKSKVVRVKDIYDEFNGNPMENLYVYRDRGATGVTEGKSYKFKTYDEKNLVSSAAIGEELLAVTTSAYTESYSIVNSLSDLPSSGYVYVDPTAIEFDKGLATSGTCFKTIVHVPANETLNQLQQNVETYYCNTTAPTGATTIDDVVTKSLGYDQNEKKDVSRIEIVDWDDGLTKSFVIPTADWTSASSNVKVQGLKFTEYNTADSKFILIRDNGTFKFIQCKGIKPTDENYASLREVAADLAIDPTEIANENYAILVYQLAKDDSATPETIKTLVVKDSSVYEANGFYQRYDATWTMFLEQGQTKLQIYSTYAVNDPVAVVKPWQVSFDGEGAVEKMTAIPSSEVFSDPSGIWKDGYTAYTQTDSQPGNGDIEMYQSHLADQLVIGAIGPGEFGNDVGISIITPEAAKIPALYGPNAFSWLWRYDDEDKVRESGLDYKKNPTNLTWKKVYKINVYVKAKSKTEAVWGFGLDALKSSPVESWLVSNDPSAKDENGNSLWAPYVINGNSQYIYVSKKSVEKSVNYKGEFAMPAMTWSIYQMTGGTNSKMNNVKEKMSALSLYSNRKKATFDYLFNVDPIDTFSGKQKYMALQNRIAQIAMKRKMDLGIIQCTSKEAKTIRQKVSEAKMFSFSDGSYVAGYDDYDQYFDPFTSSWVMLPRSVAGAVAMCFCDNFIQTWMAPAGVTQGRIAYSQGPMVRLEDDEFGQLYDLHINTSMYFQGYGECLMGQKTMLKKESALNRIDVRKLCNFIEKRLENKLIPYLYQKNTSTNRSTMRTSVDSFLGRIQTAGGIISKKVEVIPDQTNTHLVYVKISFVPSESIERIEVVLTLNRESGTISSEESVTRL